MSWWLGFLDRRRLGAFAKSTEALARAVGSRPGERLLDVGGGTGVLTERFGGGFSEVVVVEPNPKKRAHGQSARPTLRFVAGTAEQLDFPDGHFDCVTAVVSLHHFQDRDAAVREIHRVLGRNGRLVVFEFHPSSGPGRFLRFLHRAHGGKHAAVHHGFLDPSELGRLLKRAGFRQGDVIDVGNGYLFTATTEGATAARKSR